MPAAATQAALVACTQHGGVSVRSPLMALGSAWRYAGPGGVGLPAPAMAMLLAHDPFAMCHVNPHIAMVPHALLCTISVQIWVVGKMWGGIFTLRGREGGRRR